MKKKTREMVHPNPGKKRDQTSRDDNSPRYMLNGGIHIYLV
jgi:hypothetical protein